MAIVKEAFYKIVDIERDGSLKPKGYETQRLMGAYKVAEELSRLDFSKKEGIERYVAMTGDNVSTYTSHDLELGRKSKETGMLRAISRYVDGNLEGVLSESDELTTNLAKKHCPDKEVDASKPYNNTRKIISDKHKELEIMNTNPMAYFNAFLAQANDLDRYFMAGHAEEFIQIRQKHAQRSVDLALGAYGAKKFLIDTYQAFAKQAKSLTEKIKPIKDAIRAKIEAKENSIGRPLYILEEQKLVADETKKIEEINKGFPYASSRDRLLHDITFETISFNEKKEAMEKAQKEAEEERARLQAAT